MQSHYVCTLIAGIWRTSSADSSCLTSISTENSLPFVHSAFLSIRDMEGAKKDCPFTTPTMLSWAISMTSLLNSGFQTLSTSFMSNGVFVGKFSTSERRNCSSEYSRSSTTLGSLMLSEKALTSTQLALAKGDEVDVVRKDSDGWWFVIKDGEKGLVPGSYLHIENPIIPITDAAILAAREASNQRFMELQQNSGGGAQGAEAGVEYQSPLGLEALAIADSCAPKPPNGPARADAKSGGTEFKPGEVRKLRKCYACKETILGRTKVCKDQIFHEICLLCKGCRESIEENEDFTLIKKKAYHADCAKDVNHCIVCDKEILGRVYRAGDGAFHKLCMVCSVCNKQTKEAGAKLENDLLICGDCVAEKERKEREEREAALERERAAAKAKAEKEAALAAARALEEKKEREARAAEEAARAKAKAEAEAAAAARAQAEKEAAEAEALQRAASAAITNGHGRSGVDSLRSSTSNLDEFDLEATPIDMSVQNGRISEVSDLDSILSDGEYAGYMGSGQRESLRLSEVLDLESYSDDRLSDLSGISEGAADRARSRRSTIERTVNENEETFSEDEDDRELCGGCGQVLEGEAVGALNQYFHYENMTPVSKGIAGYRFDAQDDTQLTIYPGEEVAILQKVCHPRTPAEEEEEWIHEQAQAPARTMQLVLNAKSSGGALLPKVRQQSDGLTDAWGNNEKGSSGSLFREKRYETGETQTDLAL
ncbi:unnamed protein product [Phytophthora fragariaefolia]|uniref:Unnamed protein product n=1 Tax=Phytophthora fragariaefolia TaxID=1490495 RepID=A0A9W6YJ59_9STRA|nr:unnamed protein product [Phytophthora fragariaefolia]